MKIQVFLLPISNFNKYLALQILSTDSDEPLGLTLFHLSITRDKLVLIPQKTNTTNQIPASPYKTKDK